MARNIGPTVDILLTRVRQSGGVALTTNSATQILTIAQQIANIHLRSVLTTGSFTPTAQQLIYEYRSAFTTAPVDILEVTDTNRTLHKFSNLADLSSYDVDWFRKVDGTRYEAWAQIGRDFFVLYPAKAAATAISVTTVKETTVYSDYTAYYDTAMELPDEDVEIALKIAEVLCLLRSRKPKIIKAALSDLMKRLNI